MRESEEGVPNGDALWGDQGWDHNWYSYLRSYIPIGSAVGICPSTKILPPGQYVPYGTADTAGIRILSDKAIVNNPLLPKQWISFGYGANAWIGVPGTETPRDAPSHYFRSLAGVEAPPTVPIFADSGLPAFLLLEDIPLTDDLYSSRTVYDNAGKVQIARHGPRGPARSSLPLKSEVQLKGWRNSTSFADGHVESVRLDFMLKLKWHKGWTNL